MDKEDEKRIKGRIERLVSKYEEIDALFMDLTSDWYKCESNKDFIPSDFFGKIGIKIEKESNQMEFLTVSISGLPGHINSSLKDIITARIEAVASGAMRDIGDTWYSIQVPGHHNEIFALKSALDSAFLPFSKNGKFDYYSDSFRELRHEIFLRDGEVCARCGAIPNKETYLTIDHIMPVSKFPEFSMDKDNLQVLCWPCNQGKSNKHSTDYRGKK